MARFQRVGECSQCGECCKPPIVKLTMLNAEGTVCQFLRPLADGKYVCLIRSMVEQGREEELAKLKEVAEECWSYWLNECKPFPNPDDPAYHPPRFMLPSKCTFKIVEATE